MRICFVLCEPRGVSSSLFPAPRKKPAKGGPFRGAEKRMIFASMGSDAVGFLREARWLRLRLARTSRSFFKALPRATKKARQGRAIPWRREEDSNLRTSHPRHTISNRAQPPDESPPSHDFQSCSLNHSDISAKPCNHIIFPRKRQLILRAFRQKVFGKFLFSLPSRSVREKTRKACLERGKIMQKSGRI